MRCWVPVLLLLLGFMNCDAAVRKHALIIGITYDDLKYGADDAKAFSDFLRDRIGVSPNDIKLLRNSEATRDRILTEISLLGTEVSSETSEQHYVYVYYSGHSVAGDSGHAFFVTAGSNRSVPSTGLSSDDFLREINVKIRAEEVVYFFDTCFAATAEHGKALTVRNPYASINATLERFAVKSPWTRMGIFSSSETQRSYESPSKQHGVFTYYLLEGMGGEADQPPTGNGDGTVTSGELLAYLQLMVPKEVARLKEEAQTPIPTRGFNANFPLARADADKAIGVYSSGIPANVLAAVSEPIRQGETIRSIALAGDGRWAVVASLHTVGTSEVRAAREEYRKQFPESKDKMTWVLFFRGGFVEIIGPNSIFPSGGPSSLMEEIRSLAGHTLREVAVVDETKWVLLYGKNGWSSKGLPQELKQALHRVHESHQAINHVALRANGGWVIVYNGFHSQGDKIPHALVSVLWSLSDRAKVIQAIQFDPATDGWIVVAQ